MTDYRAQPHIGARIKAARRQRGFRTTKEFADSIEGGNVSASVLENIESGRKADLSVSQLLNIARALSVPISYLLAPMVTPDAPLDLPNLSDAFSDMTAADFDSWLAAVPASSHRATTVGERTDIEQLTALRDSRALRREVRRLHAVIAVENDSNDSALKVEAISTRRRMESTVADLEALESFLLSSGWKVDVAP